jgi:hypothetical protein
MDPLQEIIIQDKKEIVLKVPAGINYLTSMGIIATQYQPDDLM